MSYRCAPQKIDKINTIPARNIDYEMPIAIDNEELREYGALSGQLGCRESEPARNTEDVEGLTAWVGLEPVAESRLTNESGDVSEMSRDKGCPGGQPSL